MRGSFTSIYLIMLSSIINNKIFELKGNCFITHNLQVVEDGRALADTDKLSDRYRVHHVIILNNDISNIRSDLIKTN